MSKRLITVTLKIARNLLLQSIVKFPDSRSLFCPIRAQIDYSVSTNGGLTTIIDISK
jgi:hypothetical protein